MAAVTRVNPRLLPEVPPDEPKKAGRNGSGLPCLGEDYFAAAAAVMKDKPLGVPNPVTLSHPGPVVREESVPNEIPYQRVVDPWYMELRKLTVFSKGAITSAAV